MPTTRDLFQPLADTRTLPERRRQQVAQLELQVLTGQLVTRPVGRRSLWAQKALNSARDRAEHFTCGPRQVTSELEAVLYPGSLNAPEPGTVFFALGKTYTCCGVIVEAMEGEDHLVLALPVMEVIL